MNLRLYVLQRATAALMAPMVIVHLAVIYYATGHNLSAADILGRTQRSISWGLFYGVFVVAAAIHGSIGLRVVASEVLALRGRSLDVLTWIVGLLLCVLGLRAVAAMVMP